MSLIRRSDLMPGMTNFFDDFLTRDFWGGLANNSSTNTSIPAVNIRENNDEFIVEMAAPGMSKEDFVVELDGNKLTISSEKKDEHTDENEKGYTRREFSYQSFQRSFTLPKDVVDIDKINAHYENGLLQLAIPKKEEAKQRPPRKIEIS